MSTLSCFCLSPLMNFIWQLDQKPLLSPQSWMWDGNITKKCCQHPRAWLTLLKYQIITFRWFLSGYFVRIGQALWLHSLKKADWEPGLLTWYSLLLCWLTSGKSLRISVLRFPNAKLITLILSAQHLNIYGWKELSYRTIYVIRARTTILCGGPGPSLFRQSIPLDRYVL